MYVEDDETGEVPIQLWHLDDGTHVPGDIDATLRTVYRDGDEIMTVTSYRDGSLRIHGPTISVGTTVRSE